MMILVVFRCINYCNGIFCIIGICFRGAVCAM